MENEMGIDVFEGYFACHVCGNPEIYDDKIW